jgi:hypothetical protein
MVIITHGWPVVIFNHQYFDIDWPNRVLMRERMEWIMDEGL